MTKFVLVLYLCSMVTGQCPSNHYAGFQFDTHYDCVNSGYGVAQQTFQRLEEMEDVEKSYMESNKIVIKFDCRPVNIIVPKPKPKTPA